MAVEEAEHFNARASRVGREYERHIVEWLRGQGWEIVERKYRHVCGIEVDILARDLMGNLVAIECKGGDVAGRRGLERTDNVWKVLGQTQALGTFNRVNPNDFLRFICITNAQPLDGTPFANTLRVAELNGLITIIVVE